MVRNNAQLIELDFSGLGLLPQNLAELMTAIDECCTQLVSLNLSQNNLSADLQNPHSLEFCQTLKHLIEESQTLTHLNLD